MPSWNIRRGVTIIEFLAASSIATVVGGTLIVLLTGMKDAYETHTIFNQLSSNLDVATMVLRNDIWQAMAATPQTGDGVCPNKWLELTNSTTSTTTTYCLDRATLTNVKLQRRVNGGAAWNVAQFLVEGAAKTSAFVDTPRTGMITINLEASRLVNNHDHRRTISGARYRMQAP